MSGLIEALKGLLDEMSTYDSAGGNRNPNEFQIGRNSATAYWEIKLGEIIAEHEQSGWRPIESAPHGERVLLYCHAYMNDWIEVGAATRGERLHGVSNISAHGYATHWQPLPKEPA